MSDDDIKLPDPAGHYYEWDGPYGKRKFSIAPHNGRQCDRAVAYYIADQVRAAIQADRERRAQQQPAEGEDIMVNTPYDVFILPLHLSGLSSGPRFVVHVPGPEQPAADMRDRLLAALETKHRTVTYVCPVCAASLERQE